MWPLKPLIPRIDANHMGRSGPLGSRNFTILTFEGHVISWVRVM